MQDSDELDIPEDMPVLALLLLFVAQMIGAAIIDGLRAFRKLLP